MTPQQIIAHLKETYTGHRFHFDSQVCQVISGDHNKETRREIIKIITGERRPLSKCGMMATSDALKNSFDQLTILF